MITGQECYFQSGIYIYWRGLELDAQMWANTGPICWTQITGSGQTDRQGMEWIKGDYKLPTAAVDKQRMLLRGVLHTSRTPTPIRLPPPPNFTISSPTQLLCVGAFICLVSIQIPKRHQSNLPPLTRPPSPGWLPEQKSCNFPESASCQESLPGGQRLFGSKTSILENCLHWFSHSAWR